MDHNGHLSGTEYQLSFLQGLPLKLNQLMNQILFLADWLRQPADVRQGATIVDDVFAPSDYKARSTWYDYAGLREFSAIRAVDTTSKIYCITVKHLLFFTLSLHHCINTLRKMSAIFSESS